MVTNHSQSSLGLGLITVSSYKLFWWLVVELKYLSYLQDAGNLGVHGI